MGEQLRFFETNYYTSFHKGYSIIQVEEIKYMRLTNVYIRSYNFIVD
jgi:hypothetical protein